MPGAGWEKTLALGEEMVDTWPG